MILKKLFSETNNVNFFGRWESDFKEYLAPPKKGNP